VRPSDPRFRLWASSEYFEQGSLEGMDAPLVQVQQALQGQAQQAPPPPPVSVPPEYRFPTGLNNGDPCCWLCGETKTAQWRRGPCGGHIASSPPCHAMPALCPPTPLILPLWSSLTRRAGSGTLCNRHGLQWSRAQRMQQAQQAPVQPQQEQQAPVQPQQEQQAQPKQGQQALQVQPLQPQQGQQAQPPLAGGQEQQAGAAQHPPAIQRAAEPSAKTGTNKRKREDTAKALDLRAVANLFRPAGGGWQP
jgi:hypothetical protein